MLNEKDKLTKKREADCQQRMYNRRIAQGYPRNIPEERFLRLAEYESTNLTPSEIIAMCDELARWHTDKNVPEIKHVFANTSTLCCHNCDHKDEYIVELETTCDELSRLTAELKAAIENADMYITELSGRIGGNK